MQKKRENIPRLLIFNYKSISTYHLSHNIIHANDIKCDKYKKKNSETIDTQLFICFNMLFIAHPPKKIKKRRGPGVPYR